MNKKVLVTGGAGFLGSHLCESLLKNKCDVICIDDLSTGRKSNIKALEAHPNFKFFHHDVIYPFSTQVDEIYNLACPASPVQYQMDPIKTTKTSVFGALNLLNLAYELDAKILQTSTSEVYGNPLVHPQPESYHGAVNPIGVRACYDEGKRCAESIFFDYHRQYQVSIKVARIFNTYGPGMYLNDGRVVSNFIVQALQGLPITIYGSGEQTRSFCYVDDMIDGLIRLMSTESKILGPVNLGNPEEVPIIELATLIIKMTKSKSKLNFVSLPEDDPVRRRPCIQSAKTHLSWTPKVSLEYGLDKTIFYFSNLVGLNREAILI